MGVQHFDQVGIFIGGDQNLAPICENMRLGFQPVANGSTGAVSGRMTVAEFNDHNASYLRLILINTNTPLPLLRPAPYLERNAAPPGTVS